MRARNVVFICASILAGCATQRFGREQPISTTERKLLTCSQIELEIAQAAAFVENTRALNRKFTAEDVFGFIGDLGIGNSAEYHAAVNSGLMRFSQLKELLNEKGCPENRVELAPEPSLTKDRFKRGGNPATN